MYKKFLLAAILSVTIIIANAYAEPAVKTSKDPAAPASAVKPGKSEDEKYAIIYGKCTKEAEKNEAKYDQIFNTCMDKNGFPQEEFDTGGQTTEGAD